MTLQKLSSHPQVLSSKHLENTHKHCPTLLRIVIYRLRLALRIRVVPRLSITLGAVTEKTKNGNDMTDGDIAVFYG